MDLTAIIIAVVGSSGALAIVGQIVSKVLNKDTERATRQDKADEKTVKERELEHKRQQDFLDDLTEHIERIEAKNTALEVRVDQMRGRIDELITKTDTLYQENTKLRIENMRLTGRVSELEFELDKFNRRVYYIPKKEEGNA